MSTTWFRASLALLLCALYGGGRAEAQTLIFQHFPNRPNLIIVCWSVPQGTAGYMSRIEVFQMDPQGSSRLLWQSPPDNAYSPQIRFVPEIEIQGLPLALVERQTGAASSQLDGIGKATGRVTRLLRIDGFKFDVERLDGGKLPSIIAHVDPSILDVPEIYRWNGSHFVEDSVSHPDYYRRLLAEDRRKLPADSSGSVLLNLSRIALLARDRNAAKEILQDALARERSKGDLANKQTLRLIAQALRALEPDGR